MALLGVSARSTFFKWKKDPDTILPSDTLERLSYIVGIYKSLQVLLPDEKAADEWVRHPNTAPLFGGDSALDRLLSGQVADLFVRLPVSSENRAGGSFPAGFHSSDRKRVVDGQSLSCRVAPGGRRNIK